MLHGNTSHTYLPLMSLKCNKDFQSQYITICQSKIINFGPNWSKFLVRTGPTKVRFQTMLTLLHPLALPIAFAHGGSFTGSLRSYYYAYVLSLPLRQNWMISSGFGRVPTSMYQSDNWPKHPIGPDFQTLCQSNVGLIYTKCTNINL